MQDQDTEDGETILTLRQRVQAFVATGSLDAAAKAVTHAASRWPANPGVLLIAADVASRQRRFDQAITYARTSIRYDDRNWHAHHELAGFLMHLGQFAEARESADAALRLLPQSSNILRRISEIEERRKDGEQAMTFACKAVEADPLNRWSMMQLSKLHLARGDLSIATIFAQEALRNAPRSFDALLRLSEICDRQGRSAEAIGYARGAADADPKRPWTHIWLAGLLVRANEIAEAKAAAEAALALDPVNKTALLQMLDICERQPDPARLKDASLRVLASDPASFNLKVRVAGIFLAHRLIAEATSIVDDLKRDQPDHLAVARLSDMVAVARRARGLEEALLAREPGEHRLSPASLGGKGRLDRIFISGLSNSSFKDGYVGGIGDVTGATMVNYSVGASNCLLGAWHATALGDKIAECDICILEYFIQDQFADVHLVRRDLIDAIISIGEHAYPVVVLWQDKASIVGPTAETVAVRAAYKEACRLAGAPMIDLLDLLHEYMAEHDIADAAALFPPTDQLHVSRPVAFAIGKMIGRRLQALAASGLSFEDPEPTRARPVIEQVGVAGDPVTGPPMLRLPIHDGQRFVATVDGELRGLMIQTKHRKFEIRLPTGRRMIWTYWDDSNPNPRPVLRFLSVPTLPVVKGQEVVIPTFVDGKPYEGAIGLHSALIMTP